MVTRPATPPYSLTTRAMWLRVSRNSSSSTFSRIDSGIRTAGRRIERMSKCSAAPKYLSRSLASRMPRISSLSSPCTGKREWPDSTTTASRSGSGDSTASITICARGTITSSTLSSVTLMAPSTMVRVSAESSPLDWAERTSSSSSPRLRGSPENRWPSRSHQVRWAGPLVLPGSSFITLCKSARTWAEAGF